MMYGAHIQSDSFARTEHPAFVRAVEPVAASDSGRRYADGQRNDGYNPMQRYLVYDGKGKLSGLESSDLDLVA